jgi:hypothetical protein
VHGGANDNHWVLQALKAAVPVFLRFVTACPADSATSLTAPPTTHDAKVAEHFATILHCVAMPRNNKLLAMLPETLPHAQLLPLSGQPGTDARLLMQLLASGECATLLRHLLAWQNKARKMLAKLLGQRSDAQTASMSQQTSSEEDVSAAVNAFVAHYVVVMPKGALTAGNVTKLLKHQDKKLASSIRELCCAHSAPSLHDPGATLLLHCCDLRS